MPSYRVTHRSTITGLHDDDDGDDDGDDDSLLFSTLLFSNLCDDDVIFMVIVMVMVIVTVMMMLMVMVMVMVMVMSMMMMMVMMMNLIVSVPGRSHFCTARPASRFSTSSQSLSLACVILIFISSVFYSYPTKK